jgi:hypothetical protein
MSKMSGRILVSEESFPWLQIGDQSPDFLLLIPVPDRDNLRFPGRGDGSCS